MCMLSVHSLIAVTYLLLSFVVHFSFSIMVKCWALDPNDRPSFEKLSSTLGKLLQVASGYLELNMVLLTSQGDEEDSA